MSSRSVAEAVRSHGQGVKNIAYGVILACIIVMFYSLPLVSAFEVIEGWLRGPLWERVGLYLGASVLASLLLFPGSVLMISAGALFGLVGGVAMAFLMALIAGGCAMLLVRAFAIQRLRDFILSRRRWRSMYTAMDAGSWRMVVLLRLSPLLPFSPANYLLAAFPVKPLRVLLPGSLALLPWIALYSAIGAVGREGSTLLSDGAGGLSAFDYLKWGLTGLGVVLTGLAVAWLARRANQALEEESGLDMDLDDQEPSRPPRALPVVIAGSLAVLFVVAAAFTYSHRGNLEDAFESSNVSRSATSE